MPGKVNDEGSPLDERQREGIGRAIGRIPSGLFILTARHEDRRLGMLTSWVQQACMDPPMVSVAVHKGRPIMPLISESRRFGICQIAQGERLILRKFLSNNGDPDEDPFLGLEMIHDTLLAVPILANVLSYIECEMICHMDVEGDHDLFVGLARNGRYIAGEPHIHLREHGFKY